MSATTTTATKKSNTKIAKTVSILEEVPKVDIDFNVNDLVMKSMENAVTATIHQVIEFLSKKYGFPLEEAKQAIKLNSVRKPVAKKNSVEKVVKEKEPFCLPFNGVENLKNCRAICCNNGLFTQCPNERKPDKMNLCTTCFNQTAKTSNQQPKYGFIDDRIKLGLYEFKDPKGKPVLPYLKYMEKKNITKNQVIDYATKLGIVLSEEHFTYQQPKKTRAKKVATSENNLMDAVKNAGTKTTKSKKVSKTAEQLQQFEVAKVYAKAGKTFEEMVSTFNIPEDIANEAIQFQAKSLERSAKAKARAEIKKEAKKLATEAIRESEPQEQTQDDEDQNEDIEVEEEEEEITIQTLQQLKDKTGKESYKGKEINGTRYVVGKTSNIVFDADFENHKDKSKLVILGVLRDDKLILVEEDDFELEAITDDEDEDEECNGRGYYSDSDYSDYEDDVVYEN
jgi:hypothetical protein